MRAKQRRVRLHGRCEMVEHHADAAGSLEVTMNRQPERFERLVGHGDMPQREVLVAEVVRVLDSRRSQRASKLFAPVALVRIG